MSTTGKTTPRTNFNTDGNTKSHPTAVLRSMSLHDAVAVLDRLDKSIGIIPATGREQLQATIAAIRTQVDILEATDMYDIVKYAKNIIAGSAGRPVASLTEFLSTDIAEQVHSVRNVLYTLAIVSVLDFNGGIESLATFFPTLKNRTSSRLRPYVDDESLLLRAAAFALSHGTADNRRASAVYAMVDAGLAASETTEVRMKDIDLDGLPMIFAHGIAGTDGVEPRYIPLDPFNADLLDTYISNSRRGPNEAATYFQRRPVYDHAAASASAQGIIDRVRKSVGLRSMDTTATSVWTWRAQMTERIQGIKEAVALSGRSEARLRKYLTAERTQARTGRRKRTLTLPD